MMDSESLRQSTDLPARKLKGTAEVSERTASHRACRGSAALQLTEATLCGAGAVGTAAAAEGLALSGVRAARLLADEEARPAVPSGASAPWLLHRTTAQRSRGVAFGAFELVAATAQDAVDQSLVAHITGLAGDLLVDPSFADRLWLFRPILSGTVAPLLAEAASRDHSIADEDALAKELGRAFDRVGAALGRSVLPLIGSRLGDEDHVIVTTADAIAAAEKLADRLRTKGAKCGVVGVAQLRPFPTALLAALILGKKSVIVAEPSWARGRLEAGVHAALGEARNTMTLVDPYAQSALTTARKALGIPGDTASEYPEPMISGVTLGVVPASSRAESLLCDVASSLASVAPLEISDLELLDGACAVALGGRRPRTNGSLDVLLVAHPVLFDAQQHGQRLREGGTLVIASPAKNADAIWSELSPLQRETIVRGRLTVLWFDPAPSLRLQAGRPHAPWLALAQALVEAAQPALTERLGLDAKRLRSSAGSAGLARVEPKANAPFAAGDAGMSAAGPKLREMPAGPADVEWKSALRRFHVTREGSSGAAALVPLAPASLTSLLRRMGGSRAFPVVLDHGGDQPIVRLDAILKTGLTALGNASFLEDHLPRLAAAVSQVLSGSDRAEPLGATLDRACERFASEFELSDKAKQAFDEELSTFQKALPRTGRLLPLSEHAHLELYANVVLTQRRRMVATFVEEARGLTAGLSELRRLERARTQGTDGLAAGFGEGGQYVDAGTLAKSLSNQRGSKPMGAERLARIEATLGVLERFLAGVATDTELSVVHPGLVPESLDLGRAQRVRHTEGFEVAAGLFDGLARRAAEVFRAVRVARLELVGMYEPALHDEALARLDWQGFDQAELLLVPPVVVVESAERIWRFSLDALSRLMRSGRPIHVLCIDNATATTPAGLGYLLVAHREALVLQSTLAAPEHLAKGFQAMARAVRPAVAVVQPRPPAGPMPGWLELDAALEGRSAPMFRYDPDAGDSWADCFDIEGNPAKDVAWPVHSLGYTTATGGAADLELPFTFADAAALSLEYRAQFWLIPNEGWSDEQIELSRYLDALSEGLPEQLPFIWVLSENGELARAIVSRELAFACRERMRIWRVLQELGGAHNEHARRAAEAARADVLAQAAAERRDLEAAHAAEIERIRAEEAGEALGRLARALMNPGAFTSAAPSPAARPTQAPAQSAAGAATEAPVAAAPSPAPAEEEAVSFSDPFIDTILCTSCNECTNLNPRMFKYNADKQATLADAKAGTFRELVTAAEKCPASCIHPGAPRKDDATVTDELVARASKFN